MASRKLDELELLDAGTIADGDLLLVRDISLDDDDDDACKAIALSELADAVGGAGSQPLDATLTALAGLTISANSIIIGTGADAFSVVACAANQFLARSSSGNLVAKSVTDFGLSLIDDADATAARSTMGLGTAAVLVAGAANGAATLDGTGKVPTSQIPASLIGSVAFQGTWNATTNSPTIPAAASGNLGHYYKVATAGSTDIDGITDWKVGDWIVSNGTTWDKIDNTDQVTSVAGRQGAVVLTADDVGLGSASTPTFAGLTVNGEVIVGAAQVISWAFDIAITRGGSGLIEINSGTANQFRDLKARKLIATENILLGGGNYIAGSGAAGTPITIYASESDGVGDAITVQAGTIKSKQFLTDQTTLTYGATTDVDFALAGCRTLSLTGNVTLTTSNRAASRAVLLRIIADGSLRTLTFPGSWIWLEDSMPDDIAAGKTGLLSLTCFGTAESDIVAGWTVQA